MNRINYLMSALLGVALVSSVSAQTSRDDEVLNKLNALEGEVKKLRESNAKLEHKVSQYELGENWLDKRRAEEVRSLIKEVLADADTRASLLADGAVAGHDGRYFYLASADGGFRLNIDGRVQVRYLYNHRDRGAGSVIDENEAGFELRRVNLNFHGTINSGPKFLYAVGIQTEGDDQELNLDHAKIGYQISDTLTLWAGEDKAWFLREEMTSASHQLAMERSLVNEAFTLGRIQGIWLVWQPDDMFKIYGSINDGLRSGEADGAGGFECCGTSKSFNEDVVDIAFTARLDFKISGNWDQTKDFSAWEGEPTGIFVGAAVHYQVAETGDLQTAGDDLDFPNIGGEYDAFLTWTIDGSLESNGFNIFGSLVGTHTKSVETPGNNGVDHYGAMIQVGYMVIPNKLEPYFRIEWMTMDDTGALGDTPNDVTLLTFGANWYIKKHAAKFTLDVVWALDPLEGQNIDQHPIAVTKGKSLSGLGLLFDDANQDNQFVIRAQFQLLF